MEPDGIQLLSQYEIPAPGHLRAWGNYRFFGTIFVIGGLAFGALPASFLYSGTGPDGLWVVLVFCLLFVPAGIWVWGMRERLEVDGRGIHRVVSTLRSERETRAARPTLEAVRLFAAATGSGRNRHVRYFAGLVIRDTAFPELLQVAGGRSERQARAAAEEIARALDLRLEDALGDDIVVVKPEAGAESGPR